MGFETFMLVNTLIGLFFLSLGIWSSIVMRRAEFEERERERRRLEMLEEQRWWEEYRANEGRRRELSAQMAQLQETILIWARGGRRRGWRRVADNSERVDWKKEGF